METIISKEQILNLCSYTITKDFLVDYIFSNIEGDITKEKLEEALTDTEDNVFEASDSYIPVRNNERLDWLKDNYSIFEEYIKEYGVDTKQFDLIQLIGCAIGFQNQNNIYEDINSIKEEFGLEI